jgi:hypothetical protein
MEIQLETIWIVVKNAEPHFETALEKIGSLRKR